MVTGRDIGMGKKIDRSGWFGSSVGNPRISPSEICLVVSTGSFISKGALLHILSSAGWPDLTCPGLLKHLCQLGPGHLRKPK